eukprot:GHVR01086356.1.p1 GENE.GHVR01086356.1~~GHVR01086356.1.p1  ORF type:complete len:651 (-),score=125.35 GHVR01086356.1:936-2861(-)
MFHTTQVCSTELNSNFNCVNGLTEEVNVDSSLKLLQGSLVQRAVVDAHSKADSTNLEAIEKLHSLRVLSSGSFRPKFDVPKNDENAFSEYSFSGSRLLRNESFVRFVVESERESYLDCFPPPTKVTRCFRCSRREAEPSVGFCHACLRVPPWFQRIQAASKHRSDLIAAQRAKKEFLKWHGEHMDENLATSQPVASRRVEAANIAESGRGAEAAAFAAGAGKKNQQRIAFIDPATVCNYPSCRRRRGQQRLLVCVECGKGYHAECCETPLLHRLASRFRWTCHDCKQCWVCKKETDESRMLICECCDHAFHLFCLEPPLNHVPAGRWFCPSCAYCHCCFIRMTDEEACDVRLFLDGGNERLCLNCKDAISSVGPEVPPPGVPAVSRKRGRPSRADRFHSKKKKKAVEKEEEEEKDEEEEEKEEEEEEKEEEEKEEEDEEKDEKDEKEEKVDEEIVDEEIESIALDFSGQELVVPMAVSAFAAEDTEEFDELEENDEVTTHHETLTNTRVHTVEDVEDGSESQFPTILSQASVEDEQDDVLDEELRPHGHMDHMEQQDGIVVSIREGSETSSSSSDQDGPDVASDCPNMSEISDVEDDVVGDDDSDVEAERVAPDPRPASEGREVHPNVDDDEESEEEQQSD